MSQSSNPVQTTLEPPPAHRRWDLLGAAGGLGLGAIDWSLFAIIGVDMRVGGLEVTPFIALVFTATYGALGFVIGRLVMARRRAQRDAATIARQLAELEVSQRAATQQEKLAALGRVAAGIAHEVRNPLGVIRASASMIDEALRDDSDANDDSDTVRACRFITEEIDRLDALIASLLDFARPARLRLREVDARAIIERAVHLAADETRRRRIDVSVDADPDLPPVTADPDLVAQVVFGLLINAAEAIDQEGSIDVRVSRVEGALAIEIGDSGPGFDDDVEALLFEPFFTTKRGGTGLGLAVTARIIEGHGGRVEALAGCGAGPAGQGACFRVELPLSGPGAPLQEAA